MEIIDVIQGTEEWRHARSGKVTASRVADVMAKGKGTAESASRRNLKAQLVAEILTGKPSPSIFLNEAMRWGTEQEPFARAAYEFSEGVMVDQVGMVLHPTITRAAASPDGMIGEHGLVEIKAPNTSTHLGYLLDGGVPTDYQPQMLWQMACTGAQWCDFVSFDPRLPEALQLYIFRFYRDETRIAEIEREVARFLGEVDELIKTLNQLSQAA